MNRFSKLTEPVIKNSQELTKMGNAGYDNPRENIDPTIKTGVINSKVIITGDHPTASSAVVVNVCYGTSATPPTASTTTEGTIYFQYTA